MENLSHSVSQRAPYNGNGFGARSVYDDVFGGPPKFGVPSLSPRIEDYAEIFGGFHASRGSSIPVLDLPAAGEADLPVSFRSSHFDYSEVFGGFNGQDFAVSLDELISQSKSDYDSSDEAWTPAQSESLSDESEPFACPESSSNGEIHGLYDGVTQIKVSYSKTSPKSNCDGSNGLAHGVPGYSFLVKEAPPSQNIMVADKFNKNEDFNGGLGEGKRLRKTVSCNNKPFVTVSDISLRTRPSQLPPPSRPPPVLANKGVDRDLHSSKFKASRSFAFGETTAGDNSPPSYDVEVDACSSAAASAAAMKDAMEKAQAKLKSAKHMKAKSSKKFDGPNRFKDEKLCETSKRDAGAVKAFAETDKKSCKTEGGAEWKKDEEFYEVVETDEMGKSVDVGNDGRFVMQKSAPAIWQPEEDSRNNKNDDGDIEKIITEAVKVEEFESMGQVKMKDNLAVVEKKFKEVSVRIEDEKRYKADFEEERYHKRLKEAKERTKNEQRLEEDLEREDKESKLKDACDREERQKREKEACERELKEKRFREAVELEEKKTRQREASIREEKEKSAKEARERELKEKIVREAIEQEAKEKKEMEAREREEKEKREKEAYEKEVEEKIIREAIEQEEKEEKQKEAQEKEEKEKREREACEREFEEKRLREVVELEEKEKKQIEAHEKEEEKREIEVRDRELKENRHKETIEQEEEKRLKTVIEQEENENMQNIVHETDEAEKRLSDDLEQQRIESENMDEREDSVERPTAACEREENKEKIRGGWGLEEDIPQSQEVDERYQEKRSREALDQDDFDKMWEEDNGFEENKSTKGNSGVREEVKELSHNHEPTETNIDSVRGTTLHTQNMRDTVIEFHKKPSKISPNAKPNIVDYELGDRVTNSKKVQVAKEEKEETFTPLQEKELRVGTGNLQTPAMKVSTTQSQERKGKNLDDVLTREEREKERINRERELENDRLRRMEEEREREREREKDRMAVDLASLERAAVDRATAEARQRALADACERLENASTEARLRAERAAVERATAEARQRAFQKAKGDKSTVEARECVERMRRSSLHSDSCQGVGSSNGSMNSYVSGLAGESAQRCKARLERHQRTAQRAAKALEEKNLRDLITQRELAERNRLAEGLDAEVKRWSSGKEGNLRALLSTLQYILGTDSGWQPIPLTEVITSAAVKRAYRKATLCVHPDKLQQRGASIHQKYLCEKVFDLLKEAWNKFNSEER